MTSPQSPGRTPDTAAGWTAGLATTLNRAVRAVPCRTHQERRPRQHGTLRAKIEADHRVWFLDVEPEDGWFVTLSPGWSYCGDPGNVHCFGADTLTAAWAEIRKSVPCGCEQCRGELANMRERPA